MTYGTSHLLIGGGYFQGGGGGFKKKYCCVSGGRVTKWKVRIWGGDVLSAQPDQQKRPQRKHSQKMQKIIKHWKNFPRSFRSLGILHIHISGAANRHAPVQYAKYVWFFFFLFFFSKQSSWYEPFTSFV